MVSKDLELDSSLSLLSYYMIEMTSLDHTSFLLTLGELFSSLTLSSGIAPFSHIIVLPQNVFAFPVPQPSPHMGLAVAKGPFLHIDF